MPGIVGYEVARPLGLRAELRTAVLVSRLGYTQETYRRRSLETGCDYFLIKPVEPEVVQRLLESCRRTFAQIAQREQA
jgi:CheY-like chemotaxis protein